jgi:PAS domain S-box-containing protein
MNKSLERRILIFSLLMLTLTIAINTGLNVQRFRTTYRDSILQRAHTFAVSVVSQLEAVVNLGLPLDDIDGINERCEEIVANDPELGYCIVEAASGEVLYHSFGVYPQTARATFQGSLSDEVSILDTTNLGRVYDLAAPVYDYEDKLIGRVRLGFRDTVLQKLVMDHLTSTALVLAAAFVIALILIAFFARYDLVRPIRKLCDMAENLSAGRFDVEAPVMHTRELALLGETLDGMAHALRERDAELGRNYRELEETNLELQKSYENLESVTSDLGRSREMYRSLLDDASDAILVCDEDDTLLIVNKAAEKFFGLPRGRMEQSNYFSFLERIHCGDIERQFERHHEAAPGHSIESELCFFRDMDQRNLVGQASISQVVGRDGQRLYQVIIRDVTREEEVRRSLAQTASEMERLNLMKNAFLGLASHELKTPLTIILGYVELLQTERRDTLDDETRELIEHISRASNRLSEIVHDMVDISLIDGRTIDLASREVDLNTLVQSAAERSEPSLKQRRQSLKLDLARDLPLVRCDVERVTQAISNLLGNAVKFSPDGGNIVIKTRAVFRPRTPKKFVNLGRMESCTLSEAPSPYVEITVCDEGIGIAMEDQEAIFEKFYEAGELGEHTSGKIAFKSRGAGLGLSIVKGIVELHGGTVWVESPGCDAETMPGSTFYIMLPAIAPEID